MDRHWPAQYQPDQWLSVRASHTLNAFRLGPLGTRCDSVRWKRFPVMICRVISARPGRSGSLEMPTLCAILQTELSVLNQPILEIAYWTHCGSSLELLDPVLDCVY